MHRVMLVVPAIALLVAIAWMMYTLHVHEGIRTEFRIGASAMLVMFAAIAATWIPLYDSYRERKIAEASADSWKEKHDLQREIAQAREMYTRIVQLSHDLIWVLDRSGNIIFANPSAKEACSGTPANVHELVTESSAAVVEHVLRLTAAGESAVVEIQICRGRKDPVLMAVNAVPLPEGGALWSGRDMTSSRRDEIEIRELEWRLHQMLNKMHLFAATGTAEGTVTFVNQYMLDATGYKAEEVVGRQWQDVFVPPDSTEFDLKEVSQSSSPVGEYEIRTRSGERRRVRWTRTLFHDWQGRLTGIGTIGEDLTAEAAAERALQESERRFRGLFEQSTFGIVLRDSARKVIDCNAAFRQMFRVGPDDDITEVGNAVVASVPELNDGLRSMWKGEVPRIEIEAQFPRSDGTVIWCRVTASLLRDADGTPRLSISSYEDVTERRCALEELAESREKFRSLVEITSDWVWEVNAEGVYTYASPRVCDILGYEPAELVGRRPTDLMPEWEAERLTPVLDAHMTHAEPFSMLLNTNLHRDGHLVVLETSGTPLFASDGRFLGYHGIDRDVTEREQARDELSRLATAIEAAGDAIVITDRNGVIEYVNPAFERITGFGRWEVTGLTPRVLKSGMQPPEIYDRLWAELLAGRRWSGRFINRRKDGTFYDADVTISPITAVQGTVTGFVAVQRDITEHVALLDRLRRAEEMERVGRLVSGVAHEVRNPLNAIQAAAATLELDFGEAEGAKPLFDVVRSQVDRLSKLMHDLLDLGKPLLDGEIVPADHVCREALSVWRGSHPADASRIRFDVHEADVLDVKVDSVRLQQAIINLLDNALQHSPDDGEIVLACDASADLVRISVADRGRGIKPEHETKVFEPFFTTRRGGTGLGLSLVKNVAERHGGRVRLQNRADGAGAIAEVFLPIAPGRERQA